MVSCPNCDSSFESLNGLNLHLKLKHLYRGGTVQCGEASCSRLFVNWGEFRRHYNNHPAPTNPQVRVRLNEGEEVQRPYEDTENFASAAEDELDEECVAVESDIFEETKSKMYDVFLKFCGKLYADPSLPRSNVQSTIANFKEIFQEIFSKMEVFLGGQTFKFQGVEFEFSDLLDVFLGPLDYFSTEYKRLSRLTKTRCFIKPEPYDVGSEMQDKPFEGRIVKRIVDLYAQKISIRRVLQCFFSLPRVTSQVLQYMDMLNRQEGVLSNFIQGALWKQKKLLLFPDKTVMPLFFYFDDFEVNNPLGSHATVQKIGGTYFSVPCLPPEFRSLLTNIFLAQLCFSSDRKSSEMSVCRNGYIFGRLIDEINELQENGIVVKDEESNADIKLYFAFGLLLGDNEGLNSIQGFVEGFRGNYFCRFCLLHRDETEVALREKPEYLRSENEYDVHVAGPVSDTGVKEKSIWNNIKGHHVYRNLTVDLLHDIHEGCLKYGMFHIVNHIVNKSKKKISLECLNDRLRAFDFYGNGLSNRPPPISDRDLNEKEKIKMSGSEMLNFTLVFALLVGDLVDHDQVWEFYLTIRRILNIVLSGSLQTHCADVLDDLVAHHHKLYLKLFNDTLKPKHHMMVHFGRILKQCGPLIALSTMRFEAKHRPNKVRAQATNSRKNIIYTIAMKEQLQLCYRLVSQDGLSTRLEIGSTSLPLSDLTDFPLTFGPESVQVSWTKVNGVKYKPNMCLVVAMDKFGLPLFGVINRIFVDERCKICFEVKISNTIGFHEKLFAYEVTQFKSTKFILFSDLVTHRAAIFSVHPNGEMYASLHSAL